MLPNQVEFYKHMPRPFSTMLNQNSKEVNLMTAFLLIPQMTMMNSLIWEAAPQGDTPSYFATILELFKVMSDVTHETML